jgi:biotin transport system substrate-specific component
MAAGLALVFAGGVAWLATLLPASGSRLMTALQLGFLPFVLADLVKLCLAAAVLPALWRFTGLGRGQDV